MGRVATRREVTPPSTGETPGLAGPGSWPSLRRSRLLNSKNLKKEREQLKELFAASRDDAQYQQNVAWVSQILQTEASPGPSPEGQGGARGTGGEDDAKGDRSQG